MLTLDQAAVLEEGHLVLELIGTLSVVRESCQTSDDETRFRFFLQGWCISLYCYVGACLKLLRASDKCREAVFCGVDELAVKRAKYCSLSIKRDCRQIRRSCSDELFEILIVISLRWHQSNLSCSPTFSCPGDGHMYFLEPESL